MKNHELINARHLLRTAEDMLHTSLARSYEGRNAAWFREQAETARAVAKRAERVAELMEQAKPD